MSLGSGFTRLWAGTAFGNLSDGIAFVVIPLVALTMTENPALIAGLAATYSAVRLLVVVPVGVLVDRFDRKTILWTTNLARAALLVGIALAISAGHGSLPLLYVVFAGVGITETAADNAASSILPSITPAPQLDRANGRISASQLLADEFVGPPLGGVLFAVSAALPILITGALYAAAGLFFLALPRRLPGRSSTVRNPRRSVFREAAEGAGWLRGHRLLRGLAVIGGVASVAYMTPFSILVVFSADTLGLGPAGYGVILAVSALGGLAGSLLTAGIRSRYGYARTIVASLLLGSVSMVALSFTRHPWIAAILLAAYIFHAVVWGICVNSLRQRLVPELLRGRVNASSKVLGLVGLALGATLGGALAAGLDVSVPFLAGGILFAVCGGYAWRLFRSWGLRDSRGGARRIAERAIERGHGWSIAPVPE